VSLLRARCPSCRTLTAVAVDEGYECHACGRSFAAGLVRVRRDGKRRLYIADHDHLGPLVPLLEAFWEERVARLAQLAEEADPR